MDAIGAGGSYATMIDTTPLVLNLRHFEEFNAERRWDALAGMAQGIELA